VCRAGTTVVSLCNLCTEGRNITYATGQAVPTVARAKAAAATALRCIMNGMNRNEAKERRWL
jgi:hypothetical protein